MRRLAWDKWATYFLNGPETCFETLASELPVGPHALECIGPTIKNTQAHGRGSHTKKP